MGPEADRAATGVETELRAVVVAGGCELVHGESRSTTLRRVSSGSGGGDPATGVTASRDSAAKTVTAA